MQEIIKTQEEQIQFLERNQEHIAQVECNVKHTFAPGVCIREVHMPAGSHIIGHRHTTEHTNIMICGHMLLQADDGTWQDMYAPFMYIAKPGRKVAKIIEDVVWLNIFPTDSQDIEWIENTFLDKSEAWEDGEKSITKLIEHNNCRDYEKFLNESGLTEEYVRAISENEADQINMPSGTYSFKTGKSNIEGTGIICTNSIKKGEFIGMARIDGKRTPLGRYTNHSYRPNAQMLLGNNGNVKMVAITDIRGCIGGLDGEEIMINYSEALKCQV